MPAYHVKLRARSVGALGTQFERRAYDLVALNIVDARELAITRACEILSAHIERDGAEIGRLCPAEANSYTRDARAGAGTFSILQPRPKCPYASGVWLAKRNSNRFVSED